MILDNGAVMMMKFVIWLCEIIVEFHWAISDVCDFNDGHWKNCALHLLQCNAIAFSVVQYNSLSLQMRIVNWRIGAIVCDTARLINQQQHWVADPTLTLGRQTTQH